MRWMFSDCYELSTIDLSGFDMSNVLVVDKVKDAFDYIYHYCTPQDTILLENDLPDAFSH